MYEEEPESVKMDQDFSDFDKEIEDDIRQLKRSSNLLVLLGTLVVVILLFLLGFKFYLYTLNNKVSRETIIKDYAFINLKDTAVYSGPGKNFDTIDKLDMGEAVFILGRQDDWTLIEKKDTNGWVESTRLVDKESWRPVKGEENVPIQFVDVKWYIDELSTFAIIGFIENVSAVPLKNIKIQFDFYAQSESCCDEKGNPFSPFMTRETWVARDKPLIQGVKQRFVITGQTERSFEMLKYRVSSFE